MPKERNGKRKLRKDFPKRKPDLGYYFIATDTAETEKNYLYGLKNALPEGLQSRIVIKVSTTRTEKLVAACEEADIDPQYRQRWIVFDRDRVVNFDEIIKEAKCRDIKVGWSNPCIEIWFGAYFGKMLTTQESVACCKKFAGEFKKITGMEYEKSNQQIYSLLNRFGKEEDAIKLAERWYQAYLSDKVSKPSQMCPCTTLHHLVDEIRKKTQQKLRLQA